MPIRIECTTPGLEDCFVEVSERWTRSDIGAIFQPGIPFAALWRRRVTACYLACVDGAALVDPALVCDEEGAVHPDLDVRLVNFPEAALVLAVNEIASLGKANARLSSGGSGRAMTTMPPVTETSQA
jgi:hypothetical protein